MNPKVLQPIDIDKIIAYEKQRLQEHVPDPMEQELFSWHASWRKESLDHYLPLGWSFGFFDDEQNLKGYFIAQPQLFVGGMTQTLWVEHISGGTNTILADLVEFAWRVAKDKHFQRVLFRLEPNTEIEHTVLQLNKISEHIVELKSARY